MINVPMINVFIRDSIQKGRAGRAFSYPRALVSLLSSNSDITVQLENTFLK